MYEPKNYLALCLDPVHIGTGGYRLGRVDMSIVREPATGIPKIPGTSLAGVVRAYAEMVKNEDNSLPEVETIFGTPKKQGMLRFYDARIVLFPVSSQLGTVWVSTAERMRPCVAAGECGENVLPAEPQDENKVIVLKGMAKINPVNLGWLLLETEPIKNKEEKKQLIQALSFVGRLIMVSDKLFHHLVNDHLEVRTSVEIEDETGAAKGGALFTYEAIPRGTVLGFEVAIDFRRGDGVSGEDIENLLGKVFGGLKILGIGGMGTRGFGRIEVLNFPH
ncbi:MAG: type III-B CRISPR module RAMP protein Cmr4 [Deltaproteobacteria bacterium]|nr:type III-B CRISPR module RAMP protein Cmr4 [Deltaproteobacteria bacterium]